MNIDWVYLAARALVALPTFLMLLCGIWFGRRSRDEEVSALKWNITALESLNKMLASTADEIIKHLGKQK